MRILNTRPKQQSSLLSYAIQKSGGLSIEFPTLEIKATPNTWICTLPKLNLIQQAIFISVNAVHYFFTKINQDKIIWPKNIKITAIGQGTAKALKSFGVTVHHIPEISDSNHILTLTHLNNIKDQTIILIKGNAGLEIISTTLISRGAKLHQIEVYYRDIPEKNEEFTYSLWHDDRVDIIIFTSQQSMYNLFTLLGDIENSRSECISPEACPQEPEVLINAQDHCAELELTGSREQAAGRREYNSKQIEQDMQYKSINSQQTRSNKAHAWILNKPCIVISNRLAKAAEDLGIKTIITCHYNDILTTLEGFKHDYQA